MKKNYIQPRMKVVTVKSRASLLTVSSVDVKSKNYRYDNGAEGDWEDL